MAFLNGWQYRKKITITGATGAGTDYVVLLKVGESSGSTDYDFHLEGLSENFPSNKNDGGDLRFTASDETTLLDFWVEKVEGTAPNRVAYVWVKVSESLDNNVDIYCYFGNSGASNYSNGDNTFLFFDDFNDGVLSTTKWTIDQGSNYEEANDVLKITGNNAYTTILSIQSFNNARRYKCKGRLDTTHLGYYYYIRKYEPYFIVHYESDPNIEAHQVGESGDLIVGDTGLNAPLDAVWEIVWDQNGYADFYINDSLKRQGDTAGTNSSPLGIRVYDDDDYCTWDWIFVSKYVKPEPVFSSAGAIESISRHRGVIAIM